jgi:hypothetical protein
MKPRLLGDEYTSHKLVAGCRRLRPEFPLAHIRDWDWFNHMAHVPTDITPLPPP